MEDLQHACGHIVGALVSGVTSAEAEASTIRLFRNADVAALALPSPASDDLSFVVNFARRGLIKSVLLNSSNSLAGAVRTGAGPR